MGFVYNLSLDEGGGVDMNNQLVSDVIRLVGKEMVIKRGFRLIPVRYLPYIRTALVIYEVVLIGRRIYLSIPRKDLQVRREEMMPEPE
jgi:hypothetical protein